MKFPALLAGLLLLIAPRGDARGLWDTVRVSARGDARGLGDTAWVNARGDARTLRDTARVGELVRRAHSCLMAKPDSCGDYARQARALAEQLHWREGEVRAGVALGAYLVSKGQLQLALPYFQEAVSVYDSLRRPSDKALAYLSLSNLYKELSGGNATEQFIDQSILYSRISFSLYESVHDLDGMVASLNMRGVVARDKANLPGRTAYYDSALTFYQTAIRLNETTGAGHKTLGKLFGNISQVFYEYKRQPREALRWLQKAVAFNTAAGNSYSLTFNYNHLGEAYLKLGKPDSALFFARKMTAISQQLQLPNRLFESYRELYLAFAAEKRYDSALHYYILGSNINQDITNMAKTKEVVDLQAKYDDVKKEMNIERLHADSEAKSRAILLLSVLSGCLIVLATGFTYLIYRLRMQKKQIGEQSIRLETMLRELHHRVKNNLQIVSSLLGLQTYKLDDEKTIGVLQESRQRVQAMSLIHQRLYKDDVLCTVDIRDYLIDLTESLLSSYGYDRDTFDLRIDVCTELLDIEQALPIGLIVNELVTNAFKYAYSGVGSPALAITLKQGLSDIVLEVKDNGVGIDEEQWRRGRESFGKQLIGALCKQLRAKQQLWAEEGTAFRIVIPRAA